MQFSYRSSHLLLSIKKYLPSKSHKLLGTCHTHETFDMVVSLINHFLEVITGYAFLKATEELSSLKSKFLIPFLQIVYCFCTN